MLHIGYLLITSCNRLAAVYGNWSGHTSFLPSFFFAASYNEGIIPCLSVSRDPFITSVNVLRTVNDSN